MDLSNYPQYPRLNDKVVLITGASAGIGQSCAYYFAASGSKLILTARRVNLLEALRDSILTAIPSARIHVAPLDVSKHDQVDQLVSSLPDEFKNVDILVNNAGLALGVNTAVENELNAIDTVLDVNVKGVLYMIRAFVPGMIARGSGFVINVSSIAGTQAYKGGSIYCASKHAVQAITNSLRKELVANNIRVAAICPGLVETEFSIVRFGGDKERADNCYKDLDPLVADDIADLIAYTASRPPHVQIADVLILPTAQASVEMVHRRT